MRYKYINFAVVCTFTSVGRVSTNHRVSANGSKIDFKELFESVYNSHGQLSFRGSDSEINIIIITDTGIYTKTIDGRKLEKIFKRLIK